MQQHTAGPLHTHHHAQTAVVSVVETSLQHYAAFVHSQITLQHQAQQMFQVLADAAFLYSSHSCRPDACGFAFVVICSWQRHLCCGGAQQRQHAPGQCGCCW
jgi:hypothetical protein